MMTTGMLEALMRLFALFAAGGTSRHAMYGRQAASRYLKGRLNAALSEHYLQLYDVELARLEVRTQQSKERPLVSVPMSAGSMEWEMNDAAQAKLLARLSAKLMRACAQINKELALRERFVVYLRLAEFGRDTQTGDGAESFLTHAAQALHLPESDVEAMRALVRADHAEEVLVWGRAFAQPLGHTGANLLAGVHLEGEDLFFVRTFGRGDMRLNGQPLPEGVVAPMGQGSVLKDGHGHALFYSDLVRSCLRPEEVTPVQFQVQDLAHFFAFPQAAAVRLLSFEEREGRLIGIMGASGSGKSTLLNILNGTVRPTLGRVLLNGIDVHAGGADLDGLIGHIAQEDVLVAELSVRDNLLYSARLSFKDLDEEALHERVDETLERLGLWAIRDLRVGSVMDKTISGGQRKRLNIALELVREPLVLFVDEPTSGLSSRDSEHIMDLLKELTLRGKLIFVVIHQPSSDIFKLFDQLLLLDTGGYPIFYGNPLESLTYFKGLSDQVNAHDMMCEACGNVNPELLFSIIESRMVDEFGHQIPDRRMHPRDWNGHFHELIAPRHQQHEPVVAPQPEPRKAPSRWGQWLTYLRRDLHAKRMNRQYLAINLLEAPVLAVLLAGFARFYELDGAYAFRTSENLPPFLFISVIVALFMGLSMSAEEIIRDRPMLRRERFLNLSWGAYLSAKVAIMLAFSLVQTSAYVTVSTLLLDLPTGPPLTMLFCVLFSVSAYANLLGLTISSAFNSAKVIYILIPLLIIPQIIFGGVIIRYDRFNPMLTAEHKVPWIGNAMASRWGFEALAVELSRNNRYDALFNEWEDQIARSAWRRDFWVPAYSELAPGPERTREVQRAQHELESWGLQAPQADEPAAFKAAFAEAFKSAFRARDEQRRLMEERSELAPLMDAEHNDALVDWLEQTDRSVRLVRTPEGLSQLGHFQRQPADGRSGWTAPYYAPFKQVGGTAIKTPIYNLMVLWGMAVAWGVLLWTKAFECFDRASRKRLKKRLIRVGSAVRGQFSWLSMR
jgi:ABC-type multidrug transport system ATPase subunit